MMLEQLLEQFGSLSSQVASQTRVPDGQGDGSCSECDRMYDQLEQLSAQVAELEQQNEELASRVANSQIENTVEDSSAALSWEDRKKMILEQMEDDSYDAESFLATLPSGEECTDADDYLEQLREEVDQRNKELLERDNEIRELRCLLDQQSESRNDGMAIGAAAIAELVDNDDLVQQERKRLQEIQEEWEEKFRQAEIEASLERAKLSRERQELAQKRSELDEQLEHIQRETRQVEDNAPTRRWLAKLGLADSDD